MPDDLQRLQLYSPEFNVLLLLERWLLLRGDLCVAMQLLLRSLLIDGVLVHPNLLL